MWVASARPGRSGPVTHVRDHLPPGLVPLAVIGPLLLLLQHAVARGSVLQGELAHDLAEPVDANLPYAIGRVAQEQQEGMEPGGKRGRKEREKERKDRDKREQGRIERQRDRFRVTAWCFVLKLSNI